MKRTVCVSLALLVLAFASVGSVPVGSWIERVQPAIVQLDLIKYGQIETGGNGFILCDPHVIVTAWHVVTNAGYEPIDEIDVSQYGGPRVKTEVLYHDNDVDVALVKVPEVFNNNECLGLADSMPPVGSPALYASALGAIIPSESGYGYEVIWSDFFYKKGEITSCCRDYSVLVRNEIGNRWDTMAHLNVGSPAGTSGSPILTLNNDDVRVIGVLVGGFSRVDTLFVSWSDLVSVIKRYKGE